MGLRAFQSGVLTVLVFVGACAAALAGFCAFVCTPEQEQLWTLGLVLGGVALVVGLGTLAAAVVALLRDDGRRWAAGALIVVAVPLAPLLWALWSVAG